MALLYKENITIIRSHSDVYSSSFEHLDNAVTHVIVLYRLPVVVLYRPPVYNEPGHNNNNNDMLINIISNAVQWTS